VSADGTYAGRWDAGLFATIHDRPWLGRRGCAARGRQGPSPAEYKAGWYGRTVIAVDRFCPSSKTCSACGVITAKMPLNVREWACAACGVRHDRDVNAAKVIRAEGLSVQACGDGVRPSRA
jgi:hypothetical protein